MKNQSSELTNQNAPVASNSATYAAAGNLAFLLSVIRSGESLSPEEEANVRSVIRRLEMEPNITKAATSLVEQLERVHGDPRYRRVWELAQSYQGQYAGPKYEQELNALKAAVNVV